MAGKKQKSPRPVKQRQLPPDANSLEVMILALTHKLQKRVGHMKDSFHDGKNRRGVKVLFEQRAAAFAKLQEIDADRAAALFVAIKQGGSS